MTALAGSVLGTPLHTAADDDRAVSFLLADLHVPSHGGQVLQQLQQWLQRAMACGRSARVLVLGDLFDSYVAAAQLRHGVWAEVAAAFAGAAAAGVSITLLHGNRDFLLDRRFAELARCRVVAGGLWCVLAGRRTLLLHGDELCQDDLPYQRAKRWLRSAPVRWLSHCLPLRTALWVASRARRRSPRVIAAGDQRRFDPTPAAVRAVFAAGAEQLLFGHIHRPACGGFEGHAYAVLPAFDQRGVGLQFEADQWQWVDAMGVPQPAPPPATWLGPAAPPAGTLR